MDEYLGNEPLDDLNKGFFTLASYNAGPTRIRQLRREAARRKIPVSYAKRHVGRQVVGGQQTTMPLKINMGGVIPVIFASSVLSRPFGFTTFCHDGGSSRPSVPICVGTP